MNGVASEFFAVAVMLGGAWAFTRWLGWILDGVDEAIDETFGDVPSLPEEAKAASLNSWRGGSSRNGPRSSQEEPRTAPLGKGI